MKNEIIFNSVVFGFMINGEPVGVEFHNEGRGEVNGQTYGTVYEVKIKYKGFLHSFRTSHYANKSNAKEYLQKIVNDENTKQ